MDHQGPPRISIIVHTENMAFLTERFPALIELHSLLLYTSSSRPGIKALKRPLIFTDLLRVETDILSGEG